MGSGTLVLHIKDGPLLARTGKCKKMKQHQAKKVTKKGSKRYAPKKANVKKTAGRKPLAKKSGKKTMKVGK